MSIGAQILECLKASDTSTTQLARRLDIPEKDLIEMLQGKRDLRAEDLASISHCLGIEPEKFMEGL